MRPPAWLVWRLLFEADMGLVEGVDYIFFPDVDVVDDRVRAGATVVSLVGTRRYVFLVPPHADCLDELLSRDGLTIERLEAELCHRRIGDDQVRVFELDRLEQFSMKIGMWGHTRLKALGDDVQLVTIRGAANRTRAQVFYRHRLN